MVDDTLKAIGPRLRNLRRNRGLTLDQLSRSAGISASTLSRLESGKRQANLELLLPLSRELRISIDELVRPVEIADPRIRERPYRTNGMTVQPLSPPDAPLQTCRVTYTPRRRRPTQRAHDGYEWVYVLTGRLRMYLGDRELILEPGEAAEFDTRLPHAFMAIDDQPAEAISIFGSAGARIHLRARSR